MIVSSGSSIDNFVIRPAGGPDAHVLDAVRKERGPEGRHEAALPRLGALIRQGTAPSGAEPAGSYCVTVMVPTKLL